MGPIKTSQFAEIWIAGESLPNDPLFDHAPVNNGTGGTTTGTTIGTPSAQKVGIVTSLRIQENLNSNQRNVIGTPVPIFMPGYYQATISAQKATLDLRSWKTILNVNPLTAFRPDSYNIGNTFGNTDAIDISNLEQGLPEFGTDSKAMPRFTFLLFVKDLIAGNNAYGSNGGKASSNVGIFVCMLRDYSVSFSSGDSVVMEDISMVARPIDGSWFNAIKSTFNISPSLGFKIDLQPQKV